MRLAGPGVYLARCSKQCHTYCKIRNLIIERRECGRLLKLVVKASVQHVGSGNFSLS